MAYLVQVYLKKELIDGSEGRYANYIELENRVTRNEKRLSQDTIGLVSIVQYIVFELDFTQDVLIGFVT